MGSSPHARGARPCGNGRAADPGIISACAGSTGTSATRTAATWDHPRMRGEHRSIENDAPPASGSSPHARGAPGHEIARSHRNRIIPACAGSTVRQLNCMWIVRDHPRMRGEHLPAMSVIQLPAGSSPHARGAHTAHGILHFELGIIPACAGSTAATLCGASHVWDHPRMRGEHRAIVQGDSIPKGSSPHARGAPGRKWSRRTRCRIIPACAGSTRARGRSR